MQRLDPFLGIRNPLLGLNGLYDPIAMKGQKKTPKVPGFMREVLAANVQQMMDHQFAGASNKPRRLAEAAGVSLSTVQRILKHEVGATVDNIESVASVFDMSAYQLLVPSLDPTNPQIVHGATKLEERLYRKWMRKKAAQEV